jgi:hypothetical protein
MQKHVEKTHPFYAKRKFSIPSFSVQCSHVKSRDKYSMKEEKIEILG